MYVCIMAYGSTPYVGMTLKKMVATLKVTNDMLEMSALPEPRPDLPQKVCVDF